MKRLTIWAVACLAAAAFAAPPAQAAFGINNFDVSFTNEDGSIATDAGSHPFAMTTTIGANVDGANVTEGWLRDVRFEQIPGLVGDTTAYERCTTLDFLELKEGINACPDETAVGIAASSTSEPGLWSTAPVFNLTPPPGVLLRLGFRAVVMNIVIDVGVSPDPPYLPVATVRNTPQLVDVYGNKTQLWGNPSDPAHNGLRGLCGTYGTSLPPGEIAGFQFEDQGKSCPVPANPKPFLTLPTDCSQSLLSSYQAISWAGETDAGSKASPPFEFCGKLAPFDPTITAAPTSRAAESPTGLNFSLDITDEGLTSNKEGARAKSHIRKVVVTLPEGMTANPSQAEGLEVCSEADLAEETLTAEPGEGCPEASKIGAVEVESPLIEETIDGALFVAKPFENLAEDSLLAVYMVIKNPKLGIIVKQTLKVTPDSQTGQLVTTAEDIPQLPFSHFRLRFREGGRSPLVSPPRCGPHEVKAVITPWSGAAPIETSSVFEIVSGPNESDCPPPGTPPFEPGFAAGSASNAAAAFSPFSMRLTRRDGDQDLVRFDATLPPGVVAKLAGVSKCSDAQIARADARTGLAELASPSCPANSRIGSVKAGAGVGSQLTYVPGSVYLAGPFAGAPISVVGVVPAVAGPFDVGTVVTRQALVIDPRTGLVTADGARSEPIPHILAGIPLRVRDIQVHVDRPQFTLNPTNCDPLATKAAIWGGGSALFSTLDDAPVARQARFQAADCARLGFAPRLGIRLKGGTKRGAHPALRATYSPRPGDANLRNTVLTFPRSAFVENANFRTICTRVQYAASACPPRSVYGRVRAWTPLLDEPLEGPVYLRSSDNLLPDAIFALKGLVDVEVAVRIDSVKGRLRATIKNAPDVPVSRVVVQMQSGRKGLFVNSRNICQGANRGKAKLRAHSAKTRKLNPRFKPAGCGKKRGRR